MSQVQGNTYQSDITGKEGKEGYIGLLFGHLGRMSFALNNTELGSLSANIYYNALLIVNHIPDSDIRKNLTKKLKDRIEELEKNGKEENAAITTASIEIVGDVMDHIDEMLGIEKRSKIAIEIECENCKFKKKFFELEDEEEIPEHDDTENPQEIPENVPLVLEDSDKK